MFVMFFNVVFSMFVCYSAAFCQLCFYNKDWIGLDWIGLAMDTVVNKGKSLIGGGEILDSSKNDAC